MLLSSARGTARYQRAVSQEHVARLVRDMRDDLAAHNQVTVRQSISIAYLPDRRCFVLDGQHRLIAYDALRADRRVLETPVPVCAYECASSDEVLMFFRRLNSNLPIHPLELELAWCDKVRALLEHLQQRYRVYISRSTAPICPNFSIRGVQGAMHARADELQAAGVTSESLVADFEDLHAHVRALAPYQLAPNDRLARCLLKQPDDPCFVALGRRHEWLDLILYRRTHNLPWDCLDLTAFAERSRDGGKRPRLSRALRRQVWERDERNRGNVLLGRCYVCDEGLHYDDMEAAHDVPHVLGGKSELSNLYPACKACNRDMGIQRLHAYKAALNKRSDDGAE